MWTVGEHATTNLVTAEGTTTAQQCAKLFHDLELRHLPIVDDDGKPAAIVSDTRVFGLLRRDAWDVPAEDIYLEPPLVLPEDMPMPDALDKLFGAETDAAMIVDGDGKLTGVFTEHDALKLASNVTPPWAPVREFLTTDHGIYSVPMGSTAGQARQQMGEHGVRHLVVRNEDGGLAGVVSVRDLAGRDVATVDQRLATPVYTAEAGEDLHDAITRMVAHKVGLLPVLENGAVIGVLTRTDVARALKARLGEKAQGDGA